MSKNDKRVLRGFVGRGKRKGIAIRTHFHSSRFVFVIYVLYIYYISTYMDEKFLK